MHVFVSKQPYFPNMKYLKIVVIFTLSIFLPKNHRQPNVMVACAQAHVAQARDCIVTTMQSLACATCACAQATITLGCLCKKCENNEKIMSFNYKIYNLHSFLVSNTINMLM